MFEMIEILSYLHVDFERATSIYWYKCFLAGIKLTVSSYAFDYFVYVSIGVVFATLAGMFVTILAPYAAGSGIPEVRVMMVHVTVVLCVCAVLLITLFSC